MTHIIDLPNDIYTYFGAYVDKVELCSLFLTCKAFEPQRRPLTMRDKCQAERLFLGYPRNKDEIIAFSKLSLETDETRSYPKKILMKDLFIRYMRIENEGHKSFKLFMENRPDEEIINHLLTPEYIVPMVSIEDLNRFIFKDWIKISLDVLKLLIAQKFLLYRYLSYYSPKHRTIIKLSESWLIRTPFDKDIFDKELEPFDPSEIELYINPSHQDYIDFEKIDYLRGKGIKIKSSCAHCQPSLWTNTKYVQELVLRDILSKKSGLFACIGIDKECFLWFKNLWPLVVSECKVEVLLKCISCNWSYDDIDWLCEEEKISYGQIMPASTSEARFLNKKVLGWACHKWANQIEYHLWFCSHNAKFFLETIFGEYKLPITKEIVIDYLVCFNEMKLSDREYLGTLIKNSDFKNMLSQTQ